MERATLRSHMVLFVEDMSSPNTAFAIDAKRACAMIAE